MVEFEVGVGTEKQEALKRWIAQRVEVIHQLISASDVLHRNGIKLRYGGDREEQFSCPFHGKDTKPSARVYPEDHGSRSHVWCFVCQESWDCISLWRKFGGFEKFGAALRDIEREFGVSPTEAPSDIKGEDGDTEEVSARQEVLRLFESSERLLVMNKSHFEMTGYLRIGSVLDKLLFQFQSGKIQSSKTTEILRSVLSKIVEKATSCPDD